MKATNLPLLGLLLVLGLLGGCSQEPEVIYDWPLPEGFPEPKVPSDNPMSEAKIELGRYLFYDTNLSGDQSKSCSSCHLQEFGFAEPLPTSLALEGQFLRRNASSLINVAYNRTLTWAHPYLREIERQVMIPLFAEDPPEMGVTGQEAEVLARFKREPYPALFTDAFGDEKATFDRITRALSSFVRRLISFNSRFDRYTFQGDDSALTESEIRGLNLFFSEEFECHHCHGGFNFTQSTAGHDTEGPERPFHNIGLYNVAGSNDYPDKDTGVYEITRRKQDMGAFRAPTLRNIAVTGPYMHDGSVQTLEEVLDIYAAGGRVVESGEYAGDGRKNRYKSQFIKPFVLTEQQKQDLIAFFHTLTDEEFLTNPDFADPFAAKSPKP